MPKALSFDAILAALAVLSLAGCSKSEHASPAPESAVKVATTPAEPPPAPVPTQAASTAVPNVATTPAVDAGREMPRPAAKGTASAACGASGCSPDMKKGK